MTVPQIARIAHETNRAYCQELGDTSQPSWEDAPTWQVQSAINGVQFHLDNPNAGPSGSHENWLKVKKAEGWKYGPEKNPDKKEHPCYVPYDQLPLEQRLKDSLFTSIVHALRPLCKFHGSDPIKMPALD
jgi:RyR domain